MQSLSTRNPDGGMFFYGTSVFLAVGLHCKLFLPFGITDVVVK